MAYKDPNYDPVKAHEYYEKHKKLKGRKKKSTVSTKGWSQTQQEQLAYVQKQLQKQYKKNNEKSKDQVSDRASVEIEEANMRRQQEKKECVKQAKAKIEELKRQYDNATPEQQEQMKKRISDAILNLRESTKEKLGKIGQAASDEGGRIRNKASKDIKKATEKNKEGYERHLKKPRRRLRVVHNGKKDK